MEGYGLAVGIWDEGGPDEVKLGFAEFTKGGSAVRYTEEFWGPTYDQTGTAPVDQVKVGESATAEIFMAERALELFNKIFPAAKLINGDNGNKKLVWGGMVGQGFKKFAKNLTFRPTANIGAGPDGEDIKDGDITLYNAIPQADFEISFQLQNEQIYKISFVGAPNAEGRLISMGDDSVVETEQEG